MRLEEVFIRIKEIRETAGISQKELSERASTTQDNISRIEKGERKLTTIDMLIRILDGLGYELEFKPKYKYK